MDFNHLELCTAGRIYLWVQDLRTYSPRYSWPAITSNSNFMGSSFSPQSELGRLLLGLARDFSVATRCSRHCIMCVAQGIKGTCWPGVILAFLPACWQESIVKLIHLRCRDAIFSFTIRQYGSLKNFSLLASKSILRIFLRGDVRKKFQTKSWAVSPDTYNRQRGLRSLPHLREQFKSRTDDGHASPA